VASDEAPSPARRTRPVPLTVVAPRRPLTECTECAKCCTYVAVEIEAPTTVRTVTDVLWYLYHEQVSVYVDGDGEWAVVFETRCRHLTSHRLCGIYPQRPHVCRTFDNKTCEVNSEGEGRTFWSAEDFLEWLKESKPRLYGRVARRFLAPGGPGGRGAGSVSGPAGPPAGPAAPRSGATGAD
jgi:uncharacterized protein